MDTAAATTPTANSQAEPRFRFANYYLTSGSRVKCIYITHNFLWGNWFIIVVGLLLFFYLVYLRCDPTTTWFVFCFLFFFLFIPRSHIIKIVLFVFGFWFSVLYGSLVYKPVVTSAPTFRPELFPISSPHIFFLCNFPENFAKMREKTSRLPQKKPFKCPPLLVSLSSSQSTTASHTSQSFTSCKKVLSISFSTHFSFFFPSELIPSFLLLLLWLFGDE